MIAVSTLPEMKSTLIMDSSGKNRTDGQFPMQSPEPMSYCKEHLDSLNSTKIQLLKCENKFCSLCRKVQKHLLNTDNTSWQNDIRTKCEICNIPVIWNDLMKLQPLGTKIANLSTKAENSLQLFVFEIIVMVFFTAEFLLRLVCCSNLKLYFRSILNTIDALSLCASYIRYGVFLFEINIAETQFEFILYFQMFRILRLLRSLNNLVAFRVLRYSIRNGKKDLALVLLYMLVGMLLFSNFIYFFESNDMFPSMFDAWWWSIVTMTTVGYGDMYPTSVVGRILGGLCAIYGVLMFSMTVPIFVNTFHSLYQYAVFTDMNSRKDKRKNKTPAIITTGFIENENETL
ncbi:potassium voltage-gated channel subfamily A member 6-like [Ostrea edulis]|uniref:potassium voltage-gated channel subfamily A member 6-like n=1 Tax=Ostrea edulis TaxID=37623 RepID=UPI0024AF7CE8|nr:potassium voltage-gated channel subfamily A member 6-like [Ostrea edulis]